MARKKKVSVSKEAEELKAIVGKKIRVLLKSKGIKQNELARVLGVTDAYVSEIVRGKAKPTIDFLSYLHEKLGADLNFLISREDLPFEVAAKGPEFKKAVEKFKIYEQEMRYVKMVPLPFHAEYIAHINSPAYFDLLPSMRIPFIGNGIYCAFEIEGSFMEPVFHHGDFVIGRKIDKKELRTGQYVIVVTKEEGILCREVDNRLKTEKKLYLIALRDGIRPLEVDEKDILELWVAEGILRYMKSQLERTFEWFHVQN
jgi:transcriptional regulator with XRE-family HTH domain